MVLGVIGAGNMAQALISGIIKSKVLESSSIIVSNYNSKKAEDLVKKYNVLEKRKDLWLISKICGF